MINDKEVENALSRQIATYGKETMGILMKLEVFLIGLRGLGVEVAKNLILAGPKRVVLFDDQITTIQDLGANFYLKESDVGKTRRDQACLEKLKELNPRCEVEISEFNPLSDVSKLSKFNVVCITEMQNSEYISKVDLVLREHKGALIYGVATGLSGTIFTDFGPNHVIIDENGEECKSFSVKSISNSENGIVLIDDSVARLSLTDGDYVSFREVEGMTEVNDSPPRPIRYVSPMAFSIEDTRNYGEYISGGIAQQVKVPKPKSYRPYSEALIVPYLKDSKVPDLTDFSKFGRNEFLHIVYQGLQRYFDKNNRLPKRNNLDEIKPIVEEIKNLIQTSKESSHWIGNSQDFDEKLATQLLRWGSCEITPITSFMGGIMAQEIVKYTGKYSPIDQWLWFDFLEAVNGVPDTFNREELNSRYDEQIAIFGQETQNKLKNLNVFLVGAGALGCEFLKEFALMGISTDQGLLTVTDNDHIEISNLNRQFLFRMKDVKKEKSKVASSAVKEFNKNFKTRDLQVLVSPENTKTFNNEFWNKQDFIINAVDNIKARKYIDNMCTWYGKPMIDSGTLGTKAHSQVIYPHVTNCYNDMQDVPEDGVPMCTLHNFPSTIEHCIEFGRDRFTGFFSDSIADLKKFVDNSKVYLEDLNKEGNVTVRQKKLESILSLLKIKISGNFNECIDQALNSYTELFDHNIQQLLHQFPADYVDNKGNKFWSGSKRVPHPIAFSNEVELCFSYVLTYSTLLGQALGLNVKDSNYIKEYTSKYQVPLFKPREILIKIEENQTEENNSGFLSLEEEEKKVQQSKDKILALLSNVTNKDKIEPVEFEKDDDTNHHIDFINALSNLRARNYRIDECDRFRTKLIAGKIIPAIATTTAAITGLVAIQLLTLLNSNKIEDMRGGYINLAINLIINTEPGPKIEMQDKENDPILLGPVKAVPPKWSVWDKIEINGSHTIKELLDFFESKYQVEVSILSINKQTIFMTYSSTWKDKLSFKVEEEYEKTTKTKIDEDYLVLEVSGDTKDGATAILPLVRYNFKN